MEFKADGDMSLKEYWGGETLYFYRKRSPLGDPGGRPIQF